MSAKRIGEETLFVSKPPPHWFGNEPNTPKDPNWTQPDWLTSRFHFSFAEYQGRPGFGVLRVCNDDLVQPARGFGEHPHGDMEIATYVVKGFLSHQHKSLDGKSVAKETLGRGSVQFMSAGTGLRHSEMNDDPKEPCRFLQMWIKPRKTGLPVKYGGLVGKENSRRNKWQQLIQDKQSNPKTAPISVNQDVSIFVSEFNESLNFEVREGRQAYVVNIEGSVDIKANAFVKSLVEHDGAEIIGPLSMEFVPTTKNIRSHVLIVEMAR